MSDRFQIMQFRVATSGTDTSSLPQTLRPVSEFAESRAVKTRRLTLDETMNVVPNRWGCC